MPSRSALPPWLSAIPKPSYPLFSKGIPSVQIEVLTARGGSMNKLILSNMMMDDEIRDDDDVMIPSLDDEDEDDLADDEVEDADDESEEEDPMI